MMGLEEGIVLNERQREEILEKLQGKWIILKGKVMEIDGIIGLLTKKKDPYDWKKDKKLRINGGSGY